jgi:hypothetical protein
MNIKNKFVVAFRTGDFDNLNDTEKETLITVMTELYAEYIDDSDIPSDIDNLHYELTSSLEEREFSGMCEIVADKTKGI